MDRKENISEKKRNIKAKKARKKWEKVLSNVNIQKFFLRIISMAEFMNTKIYAKLMQPNQIEKLFLNVKLNLKIYENTKKMYNNILIIYT